MLDSDFSGNYNCANIGVHLLVTLRIQKYEVLQI